MNRTRHSAALAAFSVLAGLSAASSTHAKERPQLLVLEFRAEGVEPGTANLIMDVVTSAFSKTNRFDVKSGDDIAELINLEAGKEALGCDDASCMAEIAGAMGAEYVVSGRIGKLGSTYVLKIAVFNPQEGRTVGQEAIQSKSLDELPARLEPIVEKLSYQAMGEEVPAALLARIESGVIPQADARPADEEEGGFPTIALSLAGTGIGLGVLSIVMGAAAVGVVYWGNAVWNDATASGASKDLVKNVGTPATAGFLLGGALMMAVGLVLLPTGCVVGWFE